MTDEQAILETLEEYAAAYCTKDIERQMAIFDDGDDISVIGTGTDELCAGRADIQTLFLRNFSSATATKFQWYWKNVTLRDGCAVVAVSLTIHLDTNEGPIQVPVRWTVSLVNKDGKWKWLHRHASAAAGSQEEGNAYPVASSGD